MKRDVWFPCDPNRCYLVYCWVKGKDVSREGAIVLSCCEAPVKKGCRGAQICNNRDFKHSHGDFDWQQLRFRFWTTSNAARLKIEVQLRSQTGTIWVDDAELITKERIISVESY